MTPEELEIATLNLLLTDDPESVKLTYSIVGQGIDIIVDEIEPLIDEYTTAEDVLEAFKYTAAKFKAISEI